MLNTHRNLTSLPDPQYMLHQQADGGDSGPAAGTQNDRLAAAFDQFYHIAVQTDGSHGHDDEELGKLFQRGERICADTGMYADCSEYCGEDEVEDEHREGAAEAEVSCAGCVFFLSGGHGGQNQCDRDDGKCACQFDCDGLIQCCAAEVPHAVPGGGRRCY